LNVKNLATTEAPQLNLHDVSNAAIQNYKYGFIKFSVHMEGGALIIPLMW